MSQLNSINFVWDNEQETFNIGLSYLTEFIDRFEHARVHNDYKAPDGYALGNWVARMRTRWKKGNLDKIKISALEKSGFIFDPSRADFDEGLSHLKNYKKTHGDCRVPARYKTREGYTLGRWISNLRQSKIKGTLEEERLIILDSLGMIRDPLAEGFERYFTALVEYEEEFGNLRVPPKYKTKYGLSLGSWVSSRLYEFKNGKIEAVRIKRLEDIGFIWEPSKKTTP